VAQLHKRSSDAVSDEESNVNTDLFKNIERLRQLRIEHRDLDDIISRLTWISKSTRCK